MEATHDMTLTLNNERKQLAGAYGNGSPKHLEGTRLGQNHVLMYNMLWAPDMARGLK